MQAEGDPDLRARFLAGMSYAAATVNIVTTDGPAGRLGVTVSAMSSVSADTSKPTLLVCVHHLSPVAAAILDNGIFCVNVLRDDQSFVSDTFAGRFKDDIKDKFDCVDWTTQVTGAPRVVDPLVAFDCKVISSERVGTHHVFFGEVQDIFAAERGSPLIYANRSYGRASRIDPVTNIAAGVTMDARRLRIGCFDAFGPFVLPELMAQLTPDFDVTLIEGDHRRVLESLRAGETDLALLYDFDLGTDIKAVLSGTLTPYVLLAQDHPLVKQDSIAISDVVDLPMVLFEVVPSADNALSIFARNGVAPTVQYRSGSLEIVRGLVGRGLGFAILMTRPASDQTYDGNRVVMRPIKDDAAPARVVLAARQSSDLLERDDRIRRIFAALFEHHFERET